MPRYEYKVVPAPRKGQKAKGVRTSEDRFAHAMTELMNRMAAEGWEYLRADSLPAEERSGWTGRTEVTHNLLVFRREPVTALPDFDDEPPLRLAARREAGPTNGPRLGPARLDENG